MTKLKTFDLSKETYHFMRENMDVFWQNMKVILPLVLVLHVIGSLAAYYNYASVVIICMLFVFFVNGLFVLSWHRISLLGPDNSLRYTKESIGKNEWLFIGLFLVVTMIGPMIVGGIAGSMAGGLSVMAKRDIVSQPVVITGVVVTLVLAIYMIVWLLRASFILPARSVGVKLTWKEARRSSKGAVWPVIATGGLFTTLFMLVVMAYSVVTGVIVGVTMRGDLDNESLSFAVMKMIVEAPAKFVELIILAFFVTCLSKAYQWGIANNPIEKSEAADA